MRCAEAKAANVTTDVDVVEIELLGVCFLGIVLGLVLLGSDIFLAESCI